MSTRRMKKYMNEAFFTTYHLGCLQWVVPLSDKAHQAGEWFI